ATACGSAATTASSTAWRPTAARSSGPTRPATPSGRRRSWSTARCCSAPTAPTTTCSTPTRAPCCGSTAWASAPTRPPVSWPARSTSARPTATSTASGSRRLLPGGVPALGAERPLAAEVLGDEQELDLALFDPAGDREAAVHALDGGLAALDGGAELPGLGGGAL